MQPAFECMLQQKVSLPYSWPCAASCALPTSSQSPRDDAYGRYCRNGCSDGRPVAFFNDCESKCTPRSCSPSAVSRYAAISSTVRTGTGSAPQFLIQPHLGEPRQMRFRQAAPAARARFQHHGVTIISPVIGIIHFRLLKKVSFVTPAYDDAAQCALGRGLDPCTGTGIVRGCPSLTIICGYPQLDLGEIRDFATHRITCLPFTAGKFAF